MMEKGEILEDQMLAFDADELSENAYMMGYTQEQVQDMVDGLWEERQQSAESDLYSMMMPFVAPPKVGRNDLCPCGSGKKNKNCCGRGN